MNVSQIRVTDHRRADHEVLPVFVNRWSPRAMNGEAIAPAEFARVLEAARWAPSSYNEQPWRFLYAHRGTPHWATFFDLLMDLNKAWAVNAGALLAIVSKKTFTHNAQANGVHVFDAGAAWQNLALQGASMGLVVHGMAGFDRTRARTVLRVPDDFEICAMAAVGKPGEISVLPEPMRPREVPSPRKPIAEISTEGPFPG